MFCALAVHSKTALLNWVKESLSTETCAHTCQSQFNSFRCSIPLAESPSPLLHCQEHSVRACYLRVFAVQTEILGGGICATSLCYSQKPQNYQNDLLLSLRFKQRQFCTEAPQSWRASLDSLEFEVNLTNSSPRRTLMRQHHEIEPAMTSSFTKLPHSSTNRKKLMALANTNMKIRTLTKVSARCQVDLGMLAKAHKFSRLLALQNSSKDDGMSKMRLVD